MKKSSRSIYSILAILVFFPLQGLSADPSCSETVISTPNDCGGLYGGFTWLYLKPTPTDGDLQAGTLLSPTPIPPDLRAVVRQLEPHRTSAYRGTRGYYNPCQSLDFSLDYFYYSSEDHLNIDQLKINQFFQNFLGSSFKNLRSSARERINQIDFKIGKRYLIDECLMLQPYIGLSYAGIRRKLHVNYTEGVSGPQSVEGTEKGKYYGAGPSLGTSFTFPLPCSFSLQGNVGAGVLFGDIKSKVNATAVLEDSSLRDFDAKDSYLRGMTMLNTQLALVFKPCFQFCNLGFELKFGYETDYYFKAVDRIDPFNGFTVNDNTFPVKASSNLGLGGPFVQLTVAQFDIPDHDTSDCFSCDCFLGGAYGKFTSSWLKPVSNNGDLIYAELTKQDGSSESQKASFDHSWVGTYELGVGCRNDRAVKVSYFHLNDKASTSITAKEGEGILSIDSSGNVNVVFSDASSKVKYDIDQVDFAAEKCFSPFCNTELNLSFGLRYSHLRRTLRNIYNGGIPSNLTESKSATLKSKYHGLGPLFALEPTYYCTSNLQLTGRVALATLMGHLKSSLDQANQGTVVQETFNTLSTPNTRYLVPVLDLNAGLRYSCCLSSGISLSLEAGYQFSEYYRAVNLVYPTFLTGLEQRNSDLKLRGAYLSLEIGNY